MLPSSSQCPAKYVHPKQLHAENSQTEGTEHRTGGWLEFGQSSFLNPSSKRRLSTIPSSTTNHDATGGRPDMMSQKKWRETKQQPSRARSGHQVSCCLTSLRHPIRSPCSSSIPSYTRTRVRNVPLSPSCLHLPCSSLDRGTRTDSLSTTEPGIKACTWLREIPSCSCLTVLPGPAWVLPSKTNKPLFTPLYSFSQINNAFLSNKHCTDLPD